MYSYWHWNWRESAMPASVTNWTQYGQTLKASDPLSSGGPAGLIAAAMAYGKGGVEWYGKYSGNAHDPSSASDWLAMKDALGAEGIALVPYIAIQDSSSSRATSMAEFIVENLPVGDLVLDLEPYSHYWSKQNASLAASVSKTLNDAGFRLRLCVDARNAGKLQAVSIDSWDFEALLPMCYWLDFGVSWQYAIDECVNTIHDSLGKNVPIMPILQNYPVQGTSVSPSTIKDAIAYCNGQGMTEQSIFRVGSWMF